MELLQSCTKPSIYETTTVHPTICKVLLIHRRKGNFRLHKTICRGTSFHTHVRCSGCQSRRPAVNPSATDGFPAQRASNVDSVSTSWRHHGKLLLVTLTSMTGKPISAKHFSTSPQSTSWSLLLIYDTIFLANYAHSSLFIAFSVVLCWAILPIPAKVTSPTTRPPPN